MPGPGLNSPVTQDGVTCKRVQFAHIQLGDVLYRRENGTTEFVRIGRVAAIKEADARGTKSVKLDTGDGLTRKGSASRSLWRSVE